MQSVVRPRADELGGRTAPVADEGDAAGQTDLSAMGVSAEHEVEAVMPRFLEGFRAVGKQNRAGALRDPAPRGIQIVRAVEMRIVDAGKPKFFAGAVDRDVFVEQDAQAGRFEVRGDFDDVVVAEDGQSPRPERSGDARDIRQTVVKISGRMVGEVAGDDGQIVRRLFDQPEESLGEPLDAIEMEVGKMKQTEAVEGGR